MDWIGLAQDRDRWRTVVSGVMRWAGHVARMGEERGLCRVLVGKQEGKRPLGRSRRKCVDNIRMVLWKRGLYRFLLGKLEGKRPLGRPRRR